MDYDYLICLMGKNLVTFIYLIFTVDKTNRKKKRSKMFDYKMYLLT